MPRLSASGFAPAATLRRPSLTIDWPSTVAVVVPSPVMSFVLLAISISSFAPMFSRWLDSSISLATVTPSLVIVGLPNFFSSTTLRPLGPSVTLTALATALTPRSRARRASSLKNSSLAMASSPVPELLDDRVDVAFAEDHQLAAVQTDFGAAVLGGVVQHHATGRGLRLVDHFDDDLVPKRFERHVVLHRDVWDFVGRTWAEPGPNPRDLALAVRECQLRSCYAPRRAPVKALERVSLRSCQPRRSPIRNPGTNAAANGRLYVMIVSADRHASFSEEARSIGSTSCCMRPHSIVTYPDQASSCRATNRSPSAIDTSLPSFFSA